MQPVFRSFASFRLALGEAYSQRACVRIRFWVLDRTFPTAVQNLVAQVSGLVKDQRLFGTSLPVVLAFGGLSTLALNEEPESLPVFLSKLDHHYSSKGAAPLSHLRPHFVNPEG